MPKKLYRATVEFEMMIVAEDESEAEKIAREHYKEEDPWWGAAVFANEVTNLKHLTSNELEALPWGGNSDKTVKDWWNELHPPAPPPSPEGT